MKLFAMNSMNDQRFFDLAMKVIAHQATDAERADLDALFAREPELRAEFMRLEADARLAKDVLPLVAACTSSTGQFPAYARERLQRTVRQILGRPEISAERAVEVEVLPTEAPVSESRHFGPDQLPTSMSRTFEGAVPNRRCDCGLVWVLGLQGTWKESPVQRFSSATELEAWEKEWPNGDERDSVNSFSILQRER